MKNKIKEIIVEALNEFNEVRENKFQIKEELVLVGRFGVLDSIEVVNLAVDIEERVLEKLGFSITIASDKVFAKNENPFYNVESFTSFVLELTKGQM